MTHLSRTLLGALLIASCATTTVGKTWRSSSFTGPTLKRVLVCALSRDDTTRRLIEDTFVVELRTSGVTGVACHNVLPAGMPSRQQVLDVAATGGEDGFIVTRPANVKELAVYENGGLAFTGDAMLGSGWNTVYEVDYLRSETEVTIQANAYSIPASGALIWSGTSDTFDPSSVNNLVAQVVPRFIKAMVKGDVLPPRISSLP